MSLNLGLILRASANAHPERTAVVLGEHSLTYGALHSLVQRFGGALKGLGVRQGQHVALLLPNVPQFTVAYFGTHYAGGAVVPLNVLLTADELAYHLSDSDAVALVVWEGFLPQAQEAFAGTPGCTSLIVVKADPEDMSSPEGVHNMSALCAGADPIEVLPATMPDDTAVILYTSGTTGRPKGAQLTHFNMFYNALYVRDDLLRLDGETTSLTVLPLFHSFGQTVMHNAVLLGGGKIVLLPRFDVEAALGLMQAHKVTLFAGVPTMYFAILHHPKADTYDLSFLRRCVSGGAAMPVEVMKSFDSKYDVNILEGYGLSETSPVASFNVLDQAKKPGSIGLPIWGVEFQLVDAEGAVIEASGTPGEICIRGHNVMKGYYNRPEATTEAIVDGWFFTGDIATRDDDGYYAIVDRKKDMVIRGGYNVYPREIEEVLYGHAAVAEAAVIGVWDEKFGEEVKAVIALKPGQSATSAEIITYCKERLAAYKYPRTVDIVDALPKGPTGKILKRALRQASSAS